MHIHTNIHRALFIAVLTATACSEHPGAETTRQPAAEAGCRIGGCSSQLCLDAGDPGPATTCEWIPAYACYASASCAKQPGGGCGWTPTTELSACLVERAPRYSIRRCVEELHAQAVTDPGDGSLTGCPTGLEIVGHLADALEGGLCCRAAAP